MRIWLSLALAVILLPIASAMHVPAAYAEPHAIERGLLLANVPDDGIPSLNAGTQTAVEQSPLPRYGFRAVSGLRRFGGGGRPV